MAKKILLIESDAGFAREMSSALEQKGFETRMTGDGKEGLDLARDERPDAVVLCVELPKMSGYSICNKLKKDEALKSIPLVVISGEATPDTFEQHKKLKTRAEDYLIKPFEPAQLVELLAALVGLPELPASEEVVTLADVELEALAEPEPLESAPPEIEPAIAAPEEDEDLRLLDDAFESIATPAINSEDAAVPSLRDELSLAGGEEATAKAASMPAADEAEPKLDEGSATDEDAALLATLGPTGQDERLVPPAEEERPRRAEPIRGANLRALRAAGIPVLETEPITPAVAQAPGGQVVPAPAAAPDRSRALESKEQELGSSRREVAQHDAELRRLRERIEEMEGSLARAEGGLARAEASLARAEADLRTRDAELGSTQSRLESLSSTMKKLEADLRASRVEAQSAGEKALEAERGLAHARERAQEAERAVGVKAAEAAEALGKLEASEQEIQGLHTELAAAHDETAAARAETDQRTAELRSRVQELEAANSKNEERVVKAYQKIKGDEKLREKTRKALTIALQLLDEHGTSTEPGEKRTAARE